MRGDEKLLEALLDIRARVEEIAPSPNPAAFACSYKDVHALKQQATLGGLFTGPLVEPDARLRRGEVLAFSTLADYREWKDSW